MQSTEAINDNVVDRAGLCGMLTEVFARVTTQSTRGGTIPALHWLPWANNGEQPKRQHRGHFALPEFCWSDWLLVSLGWRRELVSPHDDFLTEDLPNMP
jgi:hypothetical protein